MPHVEVWWSSLAEADRDLLHLLDATERSRVQALERPADQGRSLVGAVLLRVAVGHRLGVPARDVVVDRTCADCGRPHGRPRVVGPGRDLPQVSVSHSGLLVVVALAAEARIGVDVQRVADLPDLPDPSGPGGVAERAAERWVRREAVLKAGGDEVDPAVRPIRAPMEGYVAALALLAGRPPTDDELDVRQWPASVTPRPDGAPARPLGGAQDGGEEVGG